MAENQSNYRRVDLPAIYDQCARETSYKQQAMGVDFDRIVITENEYPLVHQYALEGAARMANQIGAIKTSTQNPMEALSYDGTDDTNKDNPGDSFDQGEKLHKNEMPDIVFDVEGIERDQDNYSVIQQLMKSGLTAYVLYKWYSLKGMKEDASEQYMQYETYLPEIRFNCIRNHKRDPKLKYRPMGL